MKRLLRKSEWEMPTTLFDEKNDSDSPSPFDELSLDPKSLQEQGDYYHNELTDLYDGRMNPMAPEDLL